MIISTGLCAKTACLWEVEARKPGNVHRGRDFAGLTYLDFVLSADAVAPILERAAELGAGKTVLAGIEATRRHVASNTNLGMLLLLAPLAAAAADPDLRTGVAEVLRKLTVEDARLVYQAIRLARPGGLGQAAAQDVHEEPTWPLREVMALAADRDLVARQYADDFREVFDEGVPALARGLNDYGALEDAIIGTHLHFMADHPDSLIARKRGPAEAVEASRRARAVFEAGWPGTADGHAACAALDAWLRAEGNARNPGTSADLVTASLFAALRQGIITLPSPWPWSSGEHHAAAL